MPSPSEKESVALGSIFASGAMTVGKFVVGITTGSLGILGEALHSFLDLGATVMTYFAVRIADEPADFEHPYGHGKVESVAALIETGLLFLTAAWVGYEAILRLISGKTEVEASVAAVAVIGVSIGIDFWRARALMRVAKAEKSQALEADALHFSSDIWSSSAVLVGLAGVFFGFPQADAIAALIVAGFVCRVGWQLGTRTIAVLIDSAPDGLAERIAEIASSVPGVVSIRLPRTRLAGKIVFAEIEIGVSAALPLARAGKIVDEVREVLVVALPEVDASIRSVPISLSSASVAERVRIAAQSHGLSAHHIAVFNFSGSPCVSFDLEVDGDLSISDAHSFADAVERSLHETLGDDLSIDIHIDPFRQAVETGVEIFDEEFLASVQQKLNSVVQSFPLVLGVHDLRLRTTDEGLYFSAHALFAPKTAVVAVHDEIERLEFRLRGVFHAARVVVHAEPMEAGEKVES